MLIPANDVPYTLCLPTVYGQVLVNRYDLNQTNALVKTPFGFDKAEIEVLSSIASFLPEKSICLDIGANFGLYTLALARAIRPRNGVVHAFEAQRILAYMICGSVALNSLENVFVHHLAVGAENNEIAIPALDYRKTSNFGSVEFGGPQKEFMGQEIVGKADEKVQQIRIDDFAFSNVGLMKIDIEGMEEQALAGAKDTIERSRPITLIEWIKSDKHKLAEFFEMRDYQVFALGVNFLCLPNGSSIKLNHNLPQWNEV